MHDVILYTIRAPRFISESSRTFLSWKTWDGQYAGFGFCPLTVYVLLSLFNHSEHYVECAARAKSLGREIGGRPAAPRPRRRGLLRRWARVSAARACCHGPSTAMRRACSHARKGKEHARCVVHTEPELLRCSRWMPPLPPQHERQWWVGLRLGPTCDVTRIIGRPEQKASNAQLSRERERGHTVRTRKENEKCRGH